jgi:hypothetical protein
VGRELLGDTPTVDPGHHHIEEDERRGLAPDLVDCLGAVRGLLHREPVAFEVDPTDRANRLLVVDEENERRRLPRRASAAASARFRLVPDAVVPCAVGEVRRAVRTRGAQRV